MLSTDLQMLFLYIFCCFYHYHFIHSSVFAHILTLKKTLGYTFHHTFYLLALEIISGSFFENPVLFPTFWYWK